MFQRQRKWKGKGNQVHGRGKEAKWTAEPSCATDTLKAISEEEEDEDGTQVRSLPLIVSTPRQEDHPQAWRRLIASSALTPCYDAVRFPGLASETAARTSVSIGGSISCAMASTRDSTPSCMGIHSIDEVLRAMHAERRRTPIISGALYVGRRPSPPALRGAPLVLHPCYV